MLDKGLSSLSTRRTGRQSLLRRRRWPARELGGNYTQDDQDQTQAGLLDGGLIEPARELDECLKYGDAKSEQEEADEQPGERAHPPYLAVPALRF